jgi:hypothetical protein
MATSDKYAIVLIALIDLIKERGMEDTGSDVAFFCNQLIEEAMAHADAYSVPFSDLGLDGIDTNVMLMPKKI